MNKFLSRTAFIFMCSFFPYSNHAMELQSVEEEPPTIQCFLSIDSNPRTTIYADTNYITHMIDNSNIVTSINVPLIPVKVEFLDNEGKRSDWHYGTVPKQIEEFELQRYKKEFNKNILSANDIREYLKRTAEKSFFKYLPMLFLLKAETGSILHCKIYGYPVQLQCCNSGKISFEKKYVNTISNFVQDLRFLIYYGYGFCTGNLESTKIELLQNEVVINDKRNFCYLPYAHGKNSAFHFLHYYATHTNEVNSIILLLSFIKSLEQTE